MIADTLDPWPGAPWLHDDYALLLDAVREAGRIAQSYFGTHHKTWDKGRGQPVGEADLAVDAFLRRALSHARPDYGWLSEESDEAKPQGDIGRQWVVDPIDGTRAFIRGRPEYAVSVALVARGRPLLGAVFNPATDEFFDAVAGGGTRRNGVAVRLSARAGLGGATVLASRSELQKKGWDARLGECVVTPLSSIAYKLALVAAGRADATVTLWPKNAWDLAAGDLLVAAAGGRFSLLDGGEIDYAQSDTRHPPSLAANPALHALLRARLAGL